MMLPQDVTEQIHHAAEQVGVLDELALILAFSLPAALVASRLRLPAIVGFLVAGAMLGPYTPGFIADVHLAEKFGEVGVIFLMFGVGLHFSVKDLLSVRGIAIPGAIGQSLVATAVTVGVAWAFGWTLGAGIVLGLAVSVASTVVLVRALADEGELESAAGRVAVGWLVVEDLFSALVLVLLPILAVSLGGTSGLSAADDTLSGALLREGDSVLAFAARQAGVGSSLPALILLTIVNIGIVVALLPLVGRVTNWLFTQADRTQSAELMTLSVVSVTLLVAFSSFALFGMSVALGAFLAGILVSGSPLAHRLGLDIRPLRDLFGVVFFASVGMLFDPMTVVRMPVHVAAIVLVIMVVKPAVAAALSIVLGQSRATAWTIAAGLAQIGEFSFILATIGRALGLLPSAGYQLIITGAIISIALNPLAFRAGKAIVGGRSVASMPPPALAS